MPKRIVSDIQFRNLTQEIDVKRFAVAVRSDFVDFPDPRRESRVIYPAWYLILIILAAYLAGSNTIQDIACWAELRNDWIHELVGIRIKAPCYDTIWWFVSRVCPDAFKNLIAKWLRNIPQDLRDQLLVIDGKRLRGASDCKHITHVVELFAVEQRLMIAQECVPEKKDERHALSALLNVVDIHGAIVSMDALYAHIPDVREVMNRGADYIVGIKGNQQKLEDELWNFFEQAYRQDYEDVDVTHVKIREKGHGRREQRAITVSHDLAWLRQKESWGIESAIEIRSERCIGDEVQQEIRYYISSRRADAKRFAELIRDHWSIENNLHYILDVVFLEDASTSNHGHSAENLAMLRRLAMNTVNTFDSQRGMANARRCATHSPSYLRGLLASLFGIKSF